MNRIAASLLAAGALACAAPYSTEFPAEGAAFAKVRLDFTT
jgi:hypothetical protein